MHSLKEDYAGVLYVSSENSYCENTRELSVLEVLHKGAREEAIFNLKRPITELF